MSRQLGSPKTNAPEGALFMAWREPYFAITRTISSTLFE